MSRPSSVRIFSGIGRNHRSIPRVSPGWWGWRWAGILLLASCGGRAQTEAQPNIVVLISDDQDFEHFGFAGHPLAHTPTLDAMADQGVVFDFAFVPMSRCRPAQAALLSGQWPHQSGVYFNVGGDHIDPGTALPNHLKAVGYDCFGEGKFWEFDPRKMGFLNYKISNYDTFARRGQEHLFEFLRERERDRPFFLWWAPELPHVPHDPPQRLLDLFDPSAIEIPTWFEGDQGAYRDKEHKSLAMEAWLDEAIQELRDELGRLGELDETLFLFLIDNGYANGQPSKGTAFEKGLRTPAILSYGAGIASSEGGRRFDELISIVDLNATLLDYAGADIPETCAGTSLRPLIEGQAFQAREALFGAIYIQSPSEVNGRPGVDAYGLWARDKRWKYILYLDDVREEDDKTYHIQYNLCDYPERRRGDEDLFDLVNDPHELRNLAQDPDHRAHVDRLRSGAVNWWRATGGGELDLP